MTAANNLCVWSDEETMDVYGGALDSDFVRFNLMLYPCTLGSLCAPPEEVNQIGVVSSVPSDNLNYSDYTNPHRVQVTSVVANFFSEYVVQ